jgi:protein TonB
MRIVRLAEPFQTFPSELKKEVDKLEIIRTWRFVAGNQLQSQ